MNKLVSIAVLAVVILGFGSQANGQTPTGADDGTTQRKARILENLKLHFPVLRQHEVVMGELESSGITGLEQGSFTIDGMQTNNFLVTPDDKHFYLITAGPVDASRSSEEVSVALAEEAAAAEREARERRVALGKLVVGLPVRGNPGAPVTIVEFSDFQCPYCARGFRTMEEILEKYPDDVKLVYVHYPLAKHPWAKPAAIAAVCAAQQSPDAFWNLHDSYFQNQQQINPANVLEKSKAFLTDSGIDLTTWSNCAEDTGSPAYRTVALAVEGSVTAGSKFGVSSTPSFFVNGWFVSGAQPLETFESLIAQAKQDAE